MNNFVFYSPTEFVFGRNTEERTGEMVKKYGGKKVLVHYGGGSVVKSELLGKIEGQLKKENIPYVLLGGVQPNPIDTMVYKGIDLCRKENIDFILAIGGGSVVDSAKGIAAGVPYDGDFWDFYCGKATVEKAVKIGTVVTIPAAGSEGSPNTVITKTEGGLKIGMQSPLLRPAFSIMNPELTFTLPSYQTACGLTDMMAHVMERYFSNTPGVSISDRLAEGILLSIIEQGPIVMEDAENYDARANIMWAGMIAHNGTCGIGREEDWGSHALEHELSALYDCAHGAGLAVIFPAWLRYVMDVNIDKFVQFAERVWGIKHEDGTDKKETALKGVQALEDFFTSLGMPTSFDQLGAREEDIEKLIATLNINKGDVFGNFKRLTMDDARNIYKLACK